MIEHDALDDSGLRIGPTPVGRGVFTTRAFAEGETLLVCTGREITFADTLAKGERECDAFQIGPDRYLDLDAPGVFVNHSCAPNAGVRDGVRVVALRDLAPGEEIRYDYSTTMDEGSWTLECACGAPACRGHIGDFTDLPRALKLEFMRRAIVPRFLIDADLARGRLTAEDVAAATG